MGSGPLLSTVDNLIVIGGYVIIIYPYMKWMAVNR